MSGRSFTIEQLGFDPRKLGPNSPLLKVKARRGNPEHNEQVKLFAWAAENELRIPALAWLFAVPNWFGVKTPIQGARAKAEGRKKGVPDALLPEARGPYRGLAIEMKAPGRSPTHEQRQWLAHFTKQNWHACICYSADEAISVILDYLDGKEL